MVPIGFFRQTAFTAANLLTFFLYAALAALFFFLPFVLIQARGYSPAGAGISVLPLVVIVSAGSRYAGSVADRIGPRLPLTVGPAVTAAGFVLFALLPGQGSYALTVLPALAVVGVGLAITIAPLTTTILNSVEQDDQGAASGINNAVARVAGLLAVAVLGIAATGAFNRGVDRRLDAAHVSPKTRELFAPERARLGAARAPSAATPAEKQAIHEGVADGLEDAFRVIGLLGAGLSLLAAACGGLGVRHAATARPASERSAKAHTFGARRPDAPKDRLRNRRHSDLRLPRLEEPSRIRRLPAVPAVAGAEADRSRDRNRRRGAEELEIVLVGRAVDRVDPEEAVAHVRGAGGRRRRGAPPRALRRRGRSRSCGRSTGFSKLVVLTPASAIATASTSVATDDLAAEGVARQQPRAEHLARRRPGPRC